jgi:hemolysin activation/secretion protein
MAWKVVGNTVLPAADIEAAIMPFMGPDRTAADIESARAALAEAYVDGGFPTVAVIIPDQDIKSGIFRLEVIEQRVGRVRVTGARYFSPDQVARGAPSIREGAVPDFNGLQRDIVGLNTQPDRTVTPDLKAGVVPGTVDVDLKVEDSLPLHASVELNNRNSVGTVPLRLVGSISYDNLWGRGDSLQLGAQVAPEDPSNTTVVSGSYLLRFADPRTTARFSATYSDSDVSTLGGANVLGRGTTIGARIARQLEGGDNFSESLSAGIDYKNFRDKTSLALSPNDPEYIRNRCDLDPTQLVCTQQFTTPIKYAPISIDYLASWFGDKRQTSVGVGLVFAVRGIGSSREEFDLKRFQATPNFIYVRGNAAHSQPIGSGFGISARMNAQYSDQPLVSNEGFNIGGVDSVRGYFESEALGDFGVSGQFELLSPELAPIRLVDTLRAHLFVDAGVAGIHAPLPEQSRTDVLWSAGAGFRIELLEHLNGSFDLAWPLNDGPTTAADSGPTIKFRFGGSF